MIMTPWMAKYGHAQADTVPTCHGKPATQVGTGGPDRMFGDDPPISAPVIVSKAGDDTIFGSHDSDYWSFTYNITACGWSGNDTFDGVFSYIDGGGGYDTATIEACPGTVVVNVEKVILRDCAGPDR